MSAQDIRGGMAVEVESSLQYSITLYCCVTDGSRGSVRQNGIWHGSVYEVKVCNWMPPSGKKWHPLTFIIACWTLMETTQWGSGWCISAVVTVTVGHFCWCGAQWMVPFSSSASDVKDIPGSRWCSTQAPFHQWQNCIANGGEYIEKMCFVAENLLYQLVLLCSLYLL